jgi:hypothetical protein
MEHKDIVKKDLLRRKICEHFSKNPNAESVIIKADIGDMKTLWKVVKEEGGHFKVVEVNTKKEQYIIGELGWPYLKEQEKEETPKKKKKEKEDKPEKELSKKKDDEPKLGKPSLSRMKPPGEAGEEGPLGGPPMGVEKEPEMPSGEVGLEPGEPGAERPKTGAELQLHQNVRKKPLLGVDVDTDAEGGHVLLQFPGKDENVTIDIFRDGKVSYTYKGQSRILRTGTSGDPEGL